MCLAIPMKIESINGDYGIVSTDGVKREIGLMVLDNPQIGEYVLVHAGFAIQKIDADEAQKSLAVFKMVFGGNVDPR